MADADELRETLSQLCSDLLAPSVSREDQRDILRSLTALIEQFPLAQKSLGRLLCDQQLAPPDNAPGNAKLGMTKAFKPLLADLASRCLYDRMTCQDAIALLAALAHNNAINQRRIVRWVPGVRLSLASFARGRGKKAKKQQADELFVLTVPEPIKATYRRWRKRQRFLMGSKASGRLGHVPTGAPPSQDGVPTSCYCDDCLGAEQLLATWCRHFSDLSRWTADPTGPEGGSSSSSDPAPTLADLSTSDFFRVELTDYQLLSYHHLSGQVSVDQELEKPTDDGSRVSRIHYFVPLDQAAQAVAFDPLRHLSALRIPAETFVTVDQTRQASASARQETCAEDGDGDLFGGLDEVILFDGLATVNAILCRGTPEQAEPPPVRAALRDATPSGKESVPGLMAAIRGKCGDQESVACADLLAIIADGSTRDLADESGRVALGLVLAFLREEDPVSLKALDEFFARQETESSATQQTQEAGSTGGVAVRDSDQMEVETIEAQVSVSALISAQTLRIEVAIDDEASTRGASSARAVFRVDLPRRAVCAAFEAPDTHLGLVGVSEDALRSILSRCCVCRSAAHRHRDGGGDFLEGSPIIARFHRVIATEEPETSSNQDTDAQSSDMKPDKKTSTRPLPGLSEEASNSLARVLDSLDRGGCVGSAGDAIGSLLTQLSAAIASCNQRIRQLSTPAKGVSDTARLAATSRCRACRDELIQLCKQMKLEGGRQSEAEAPAAGGAHGLLTLRKRQARVQELVRTGLRSVLECSDKLDAWEIPDERVARLRLDRSVWASGVPDYEFYQESDARAAENRRRQRELSRKLHERRRRLGKKA